MPYIIRRLDLNALPFSPANKGDLPDFPVLYVIFDDEQVFYVGATKSLFKRWSAHRHSGRLGKIIRRRTVKVAWIATAIEQLSVFEPALIEFLNPKLNQCRKGKTYHYKESSYSRRRVTYRRLEKSNSNGK